MPINQIETEGAQTSLPPFYKSVVPLFSKLHEGLAFKAMEDFSFAKIDSAIVLTAEEFPFAQMHYPIIFATGDEPMPVVLTGIPGGDNQFVSPGGKWLDGAYIPAYVRRYPFILAKLASDAEDLTLCFDEACDRIAAGEDGKLFSDGEPSEKTGAILQFCEGFEGAVQKTRRFVDELVELDLLIDAKAEIRTGDSDPVLFHGFQMVSEEKLRVLTGNQYRNLAKSGALGLIYAHLFSLRHIGRLFDHHCAGQKVRKAKKRGQGKH